MEDVARRQKLLKGEMHKLEKLIAFFERLPR